VEKALAILGQERCDVDKRGDALRTTGRTLRDDNAAHAVADNDGALGTGGENFAETSGVGIQGDFACWRAIVAESGEVEGNRGVTSGVQALLQRSPDPCTGKRTVDKDKSSHLRLSAVLNVCTASPRKGITITTRRAVVEPCRKK